MKSCNKPRPSFTSYGYEEHDEKYSDSYGYEKDDKKKEQLIIKKKIILCKDIEPDPNDGVTLTNSEDFHFCIDPTQERETENGNIVRDFNVGTENEDFQFVNCKYEPELCKDLGIKYSDFQIDVIPSIPGSKFPTKFDIDKTAFRVTEEFKLEGLGDIGCFFIARDNFKTDLDKGGFIETQSEKALFVCASFEGDCNVNEDDSIGRDFAMSYGDNSYDYEYKICTVTNYVIASLDLSEPD
ncbi:MAG TPA: hypothetical protein VFP25_02785, partial [Nitrososphaeraceae archaeon]|nr:hypothetical protein [Nitrososphaeraceae archaeon]